MCNCKEQPQKVMVQRCEDLVVCGHVEYVNEKGSTLTSCPECLGFVGNKELILLCPSCLTETNSRMPVVQANGCLSPALVIAAVLFSIVAIVIVWPMILGGLL